MLMRFSAKVRAVPSRDPFGLAVTALRDRVRGAGLAPGEPLVVTDLARELGLSATPVREALAYLAGRGLIDGRRRRFRGYATWSLAAADVADLYRLHGALVAVALETSPPDPAAIAAATGPSGEPAGDVVGDAGRYFAVLAGGPERVLGRTLAIVSDQLHAYRLAERRVFQDLPAELEALKELAGPLLVQAVCQYHRRRIVAAGELYLAVASDGVGSSN